jgi:hypothetical protein
MPGELQDVACILERSRALVGGRLMVSPATLAPSAPQESCCGELMYPADASVPSDECCRRTPAAS